MNLQPYSAISFDDCNKLALTLANLIISQRTELVTLLTTYESHEVAEDEISRSLDLLQNLHENKEYFKFRVGQIAAFLPRNQPLYAFSCFVIVPALQASEVHFRIPHPMKGFFPQLMKMLRIEELFPHVKPSPKERMDFLKERTSLYVHKETGETKPITDAVIFTGTPAHADQLRLVFDKRTLFITNGAGHNPIVIAEGADIKEAVQAATTLILYNQGQDCAAPNSILVHKNVYECFLKHLTKTLRNVKIGPYHDHTSQVGPISDSDDLVRIQEILVTHREWIHESTRGVIRTKDSIVEPTIICKPLSEGGNYDESFAPIFFVQRYEEDEDLAQYFENKRYAQHAMYVTLYGESPYTESLVDKKYDGRILHSESTFVKNTHLHAYGIERGVQPYGGFGYGASSISISGKVIAIPTLPQRDIYEWVAEPYISDKNLLKNQTENLEIRNKHIDKLLKFKTEVLDKKDVPLYAGKTFFDTASLKDVKDRRFIKVEDRYIHHLNQTPHVEFIATLTPIDIADIRKLLELLKEKHQHPLETFTTKLYAVPPKEKQLIFFQTLYHLLFSKNSGPKLGHFLWEIDNDSIWHLLDI